MKITTFQNLVYQTTKKIPKGKVSTYGDIAKVIGKPGAGRAVGNALNKNPFAPKVPCHRVVKADGSVGGFADGAEKKAKLLKQEGLVIENNRIINFFSKRFLF